MFNRFKPMPCRKARRALVYLGFDEQKGNGSSHSQWTRTVNGRLHKVTLDCHKGEVSAKNVRSMIGQAGVSREEFYLASES